MVEPTACAVHAALTAGVTDGDIVVVLGAGTLGLLTHRGAATLDRCRHARRRRQAPRAAAPSPPTSAPTWCASPTSCGRLVRRLTGSLAYGNQLTGGADIVVDCVGSDESIQQSPGRGAAPRPRGAGRACRPRSSSTSPRCGTARPSLVGAYAYGTETLADGRPACAPSTSPSSSCRRPGSNGCVSATYPLADYRRPSSTPPSAGRRGAVKVAFDLRTEKEQKPIDTGPCDRRRDSSWDTGTWEPALMPRPGFVLEVDRSTPPTLFWHGEGFRLEKPPRRPLAGDLPARAPRRPEGRRRRHPARPARTDRQRPAAGPAVPRHEAHHRLRRHQPAAAADAAPRHPPARHRGGARPGRRGRRRRRAPHRRPRAAPAHDRGRAAPRRRRPRLRRLRPARAALQPRRRGPRRHGLPGHHAARRGGRDQPAGRRERPARLRQHQPGRHGRRLEVDGDRAWPATAASATTTTSTPCSTAASLHGPGAAPSCTRRTGGWAR